MSVQNKALYKTYLESFRHPNSAHQAKAVRDVFAEDAAINIVHPFNEVTGADGYLDRFLNLLMHSFAGLYRRDYICIGGTFEGSDWVSSTGYWCGHFTKDWLGIRATNALAWLRVGEFHRFEDGKIVESYIYLDIPELMIAAGQWPDIASPATTPGYTGMLPGPATTDGLLWNESDPDQSERSFRMVVDMLLGLATEDEAWRPYWHENMMWYGPAAFGSFVGVENFRSFQVPFEQCFSHWIGGATPGSETKHFTRYGDGTYVCSGGWPSLNARQVKPFLSQPPTNKTLYMRVCDWWRREDDLLIENWVFVDIPHVLLQMGYDLFAELEASNETR